jgi:hypothetical protein
MPDKREPRVPEYKNMQLWQDVTAKVEKAGEGMSGSSEDRNNFCKKGSFTRIQYLDID